MAKQLALIEIEGTLTFERKDRSIMIQNIYNTPSHKAP